MFLNGGCIKLSINRGLLHSHVVHGCNSASDFTYSFPLLITVVTRNGPVARYARPYCAHDDIRADLCVGERGRDPQPWNYYSPLQLHTNTINNFHRHHYQSVGVHCWSYAFSKFPGGTVLSLLYLPTSQCRRFFRLASIMPVLGFFRFVVAISEPLFSRGCRFYELNSSSIAISTCLQVTQLFSKTFNENLRKIICCKIVFIVYRVNCN